ncbi:Coatomer subunit zeta-1 [Forsythia ovata]|uniref:Coatomer subunit zeta n=1 Tax=Forsythia ovata TaxID=205694 RepID=A0ABD1S1M5_9LAMI
MDTKIRSVQRKSRPRRRNPQWQKRPPAVEKKLKASKRLPKDSSVTAGDKKKRKPRRTWSEFCPSVKNILLLDSEGKRIAVKYYSDDWPTNNAKEAFEKAVFNKTQKTNARTEAEIAMFENNIVVYKFVQDLHFYVTGGEDENEIILATVLQGFFDAVGILLRGNVDKKEALENLDLILLCIDEIVDGGIILETDANSIAIKVASNSVDAGAPLSEQTISQALATAREHLARSLLK